MGLVVHNSLTRHKEPFEPIETGGVRMYVCGPNLYGPAHVGHALSYIFFDVVRRYLEYRGFKVRHVQNFTDVEDRIVERARQEGRSIFEISQEFVDRFLQEMDALNVQRAHHYPRATSVIPRMIEIIQGLIAKGHAYAVDGDVYYRVTSFPGYGLLSGRTLAQMQAGARVEVDERKEHPMDFALWKAAKPGDPSWDSPWGKGLPGWHIECSAMSMQFLGEQIDLHGGGEDVRFPHHENEIAQTEAYTGRHPFVRYWIHNAMMRPPVGDEMHRHLGNFVAIRDALARFDADVIRLFILSSHYRTPQRWTDEAVEGAARGVERLRTALANADLALERHRIPPDGPLADRAAAARRAFEQAMDDDFGTSQAIATLFDLAVEINRAAAIALQGEGSAATTGGLAAATDTLRTLASVLGLRLGQTALPADATDALAGLFGTLRSQHPAFFPDGTTPSRPEEIVAALVAGRDRARHEKRFDVADAIRSQLAEMGIILEDLPGGSRWRVVARRDGRT
ncbi:MAG: cysteine--tRNA ligase [Armatimonadota bacterium]